MLAAESLNAAQFTLGHESSAITEKYYIDRGRQTAGALDRQRSRKAFNRRPLPQLPELASWKGLAPPRGASRSCPWQRSLIFRL